MIFIKFDFIIPKKHSNFPHQTHLHHILENFMANLSFFIF